MLWFYDGSLLGLNDASPLTGYSHLECFMPIKSDLVLTDIYV